MRVYSWCTVLAAVGVALSLLLLCGSTTSAPLAGDPIPPYDPDTWRNMTEIIEAKGYPAETHEVTTQDGYLLTVFRIPYGKDGPTPGVKRPPVILQHGVLDCSFTWIVNYPVQSLAYILADAGYDVWMGNNRGNSYSLGNIHYPSSSKQFWAFSFDDMAKYDVPALVDYVLANTGFSTVSYVGHSQGTVQMFAGLSYLPSEQLADKINLFVALGPVATVGHETNKFFRLLAALDTANILQMFGEERFLPQPTKLKKLFPFICDVDPQICDVVIEFFCGKHKGAFNNSRLPVVTAHDPSGTSVMDIMHWAQMVKSGTFQMFDYGTAGNVAHYNSSKPPLYNLLNIRYSNNGPSAQRFPIHLVYGGQDELADPEDVEWLITQLGLNHNVALSYDFIPQYAHLDFVWALDANLLCYPQILELLAKYAKN